MNITVILSIYLVVGLFVGMVSLNLILNDGLLKTGYFKKCGKLKRWVAVICVFLIISISWPWWLAMYVARFI
jgi:hypothetical protein